MIGFGVGAGMYVMYHFVYREQIKTGQRPKFFKSHRLSWFSNTGLVSSLLLAALIPAALNPVLHPVLTILIGAAAFGVRYLLKKKYNIRNAMTPVQ